MFNKKTLIIVVAVFLLVSLFIIFKPKDSSTSSENQPNGSGASNVETFTLEVQNNELIRGNKVITVKRGDTVTVKIKADKTDKEDSLHLHGYDRSVKLKPGETVELSFTADKAGRFEMELEEAEKELSVLEVQP